MSADWRWYTPPGVIPKAQSQRKRWWNEKCACWKYRSIPTGLCKYHKDLWYFLGRLRIQRQYNMIVKFLHDIVQHSILLRDCSLTIIQEIRDLNLHISLHTHTRVVVLKLSLSRDSQGYARYGAGIMTAVVLKCFFSPCSSECLCRACMSLIIPLHSDAHIL